MRDAPGEKLCPYCSSDNVSKQRFSIAVMALSILFIGFPIPFLSRTYHCFNCDKDFKKETHNQINDEANN